MTTDAAPDPELLARAIHGDAGAVQCLLYTRRHHLVQYVNHCLRRLPYAGLEADDIVQDTYFAACQKVTAFRPAGPGSFDAWLAKIARNRIAYEVRKRRTIKRMTGVPSGNEDVLALLSQVASQRRSPSLSAATHELIALVENTIELLQNDYKQVLRLRFIYELPPEEVASRMGRSEGAVSMLATRALAALREHLLQHLTRQ